VDESGLADSPPERFRFLRVPTAPWGRRISQDVQRSWRKPITSFADLGTSPVVVDALNARSIDRPFPTQEMVIRDALAGYDLLVQSPTGSGKTLAFGVPLVDLIGPRETGPQALALAPTRELAGQIADELEHGLGSARRQTADPARRRRRGRNRNRASKDRGLTG
jgi:superfamily II DNA/RNA helicase